MKSVIVGLLFASLALLCSTEQTTPINGSKRKLVPGGGQVDCPNWGCWWGKRGDGAYIQGMWVTHSNIFWRCQNPYQIALTFDDGPNEHTTTVLDELEKLDVNATFFVNGYMLKGILDSRRGHILRRMEQFGHVVAHHTYDHVSLAYKLTMDDEGEITQEAIDFFDEQINKNIDTCNAHLPMLGLRPYLRPPYLSMDEDVATFLQERYGIYVVQINIDTKDFSEESTVDSIRDAVNENLNLDPSEHSFIILQHDTVAKTSIPISDIVEYARNLNYRFVGIDECLGFPKERSSRPDGPSKTPHPTQTSTDAPVVSTDSPTTSPTEDLSCTGNRCSDKNECRSKWGFCGKGSEYCDANAIWSKKCENETKSPTVSKSQDTDEDKTSSESFCSGEPCDKMSECRSEFGFCGETAKFCNRKSTWSKICVPASQYTGGTSGGISKHISIFVPMIMFCLYVVR